MDRYDEAIEYLVERPEEVGDAWHLPDDEEGGLLFQCCSSSSGCLTQVHGGSLRGPKPELTLEIIDDDRLHKSIGHLSAALLSTDSLDARRAILQPYAEWQRRMDREIRGIV